MRDTIKTKEHYDGFVKSLEVLSDEKVRMANYEKRPRDDAGFRSLGPTIDCYCEAWIECISAQYSRGDALADIQAERIDIALDRYLFIVGEMEKGNPPKYFYWSARDGVSPHGLHDCYSILCWFICFGGDAEKIKQIVPRLAPAGADRVLDSVCSLYQPDREIAEGSAHPLAFGLLDKALTEPEKATQHILKYLNNWWKYTSKIRLRTIASTGTTQTKTREALMELAEQSDAHKGYWAWEVALLVKCFNLDDSEFKDHEFYPHDLVHFMSDAH